MEIIHFADTHIGVTTHGHTDSATGVNTRVQDFLKVIDYMIDYIEDIQADLVVFAGDAFHKSTPNPNHFKEFALRVREISDIAPIVLVPGNHDQAAANRISAVNVFEVFDIPNIYTTDKPKAFLIDTPAGKAYVGCLPYPMRNQWMSHKDAKEVDDPHLLLMDLVDEAIETMAWEISNHRCPSILVGHATVEGSQFGAYTGSVIGKDAHILKDSFQGWDYVALGHIHKYQDVGTKKHPIVYSGSLERIDFGEEAEPKGFCHVTISNDIPYHKAGRVRYKFVEVPARPMVTYELDLTEDDTNISIDDEIDTEAIVRLRYKAHNWQFISHKDAKNIIKSRVNNIVLNRITVSEAVTRIPRDEDVNDWYDDELLDYYFQDKGVDDDEIEELLDLFDEITEDVD